MERFDVCVIGGGILGCLTARELAKRSLSCVLAEKREDLCLEISKVNTAVLYPGYDHKPGTLKSRFAVEGNRLTALACEELGIPIDRCGSLMAAKGPAGERILLGKYEQGQANHVPGLCMLGRQEIPALEPALSSEVTAALFAPGTAVIYPWRLGMAAAGEAASRGAVIRLRTRICGIRRENTPSKKYVIVTHSGEEFAADCVINAAGMAADRIRELLFAPKYRIRPSKADYLVYGREENPGFSHVVFYEPEDGQRGITLVPGMNGTILAGASRRPYEAGKQQAHGAPPETESETTAEGLSFLRDRIGQICPSLSFLTPIRSFAGLRPEPYEVMADSLGRFVDTGRSIHSFVIEADSEDGSFISLLGIKTPGITASVPIAKYVADMAAGACRGITAVLAETGKTDAELSSGHACKPDGKQQEAAADSGSHIICRCEQVTESQIREAVRNGAASAEGVKLRCSAGMGKCQGARCRRDVEKILEDESGGRRGPSDLPDVKSRQEQKKDLECGLLIIGAGAAGLSLALELKGDAPGLDILITDREETPGGVLQQCLHEGFPESDRGRMLDGPAYCGLLWKEVSGQNIRCLFGTHVTGITQEDRIVYAEASSPAGSIRISAGQAVIACGAIERTAGMMMIPGSRPRGVYTAGEVQRMLNLEDRLPGKRAVVVGAGNMGLIVSDLMIRRGMDVVRILEKEEHVTALLGNIRKYLENGDSVIRKEMISTGNRVARICGGKKLEGITVSPGGEFIPCDTLVIAAGLIPDRQLLYESGLGETSEKVFLFGNCDRIWQSVMAIRQAAKRKAKDILLMR